VRLKPTPRAATAGALLSLVLSASWGPAALAADPAPPTAAPVFFRATDGGRVLRPAPSALRRYARRRLRVSCSSVGRANRDDTNSFSAVRTTVRIRPGLRLRVSAPANDFCIVTLVSRRRVLPSQELGLTAAGRAHVAARLAARELLVISSVCFELRPPGVPATEPLAAALHLRPLAAPEAADLPAGVTGVWSDGRQRVFLAESVSGGRTLYFDVDAKTKAVRTNFLELIVELQSG
jgi:hypothetical protein